MNSVSSLAPLIRIIQRLCLASFAGVAWALSAPTEVDSIAPRPTLSSLSAPVPVQFSHHARPRAERLQQNLREMSDFFRQKLGIESNAKLALLNAEDWRTATTAPFGWVHVRMHDQTLFLPSEPGGLAHRRMAERHSGIPSRLLRPYLKSTRQSFSDITANRVDLLALHELGHLLSAAHGIHAPTRWLDEWIASYFAYAFMAERRPDLKKLYDLFSHPPRERPRVTTLNDFEKRYERVDNYSWYQAQFDAQVCDIYSTHGFEFLIQLKSLFPKPPPAAAALPNVRLTSASRTDLTPQTLDQLERVAPGFRKWAQRFGD